VDRPVNGQSSRGGLLRRISLVAVTTLAGGLMLTVPAAQGAPEKHPTPVDEPGVTASLWEWNWESVGSECGVLAKDGYTGVQVAPPQNSVKRTELGNGSDTILHPWWEVYQPVPTT
jgi:alpha-amylase